MKIFLACPVRNTIPDWKEGVDAADLVAVAWDGKSQGVLFDLGMAFALGERIQALDGFMPSRTTGKSFQNVVYEMEGRGGDAAQRRRNERLGLAVREAIGIDLRTMQEYSPERLRGYAQRLDKAGHVLAAMVIDAIADVREKEVQP